MFFGLFSKKKYPTDEELDQAKKEYDDAYEQWLMSSHSEEYVTSKIMAEKNKKVKDILRKRA